MSSLIRKSSKKNSIEPFIFIFMNLSTSSRVYKDYYIYKRADSWKGFKNTTTRVRTWRSRFIKGCVLCLPWEDITHCSATSRIFIGWTQFTNTNVQKDKHNAKHKHKYKKIYKHKCKHRFVRWMEHIISLLTINHQRDILARMHLNHLILMISQPKARPVKSWNPEPFVVTKSRVWLFSEEKSWKRFQDPFFSFSAFAWLEQWETSILPAFQPINVSVLLDIPINSIPPVTLEMLTRFNLAIM